MARKWTAAQKKEASKRMKARWKSGKMGKKKRGKHAAKKSAAKKARRPKKAKKVSKKHHKHYQSVGVGIATAHRAKKKGKRGRPKAAGYVSVTKKDISAMRQVTKRLGPKMLHRLVKHAPKR